VLQAFRNCRFRVVATAGTDAFLDYVESKEALGRTREPD
jgi:hypothetical protein